MNMTLGAAALALTAISSQASVISVDIHPASASEIADDAALANATIIDLMINSETDLVLSYDINLSTIGTLYNHPLEAAGDGPPSGVLVAANPALGADSHVAFGTALGGDLSSPSGTFPLSVGAPLPPQTFNGLLARITVLGDSAATITGQVFVSTDGVSSTSLPYDSNPVGIPGDLDGNGFVGLLDLDIILGDWNETVPPGDPRADVSGPGGVPDGFIGLDDLDVVLGNWNAGTPPATAVPEPGTMAVAIPGLLTLLRIRRREA